MLRLCRCPMSRAKAYKKKHPKTMELTCCRDRVEARVGDAATLSDDLTGLAGVLSVRWGLGAWG